MLIWGALMIVFTVAGQSPAYIVMAVCLSQKREGKDQHAALRMHGNYVLMQKEKEVFAIICRRQYVITDTVCNALRASFVLRRTCQVDADQCQVPWIRSAKA